MSVTFNAYLVNIEAKTGKNPADFKKLAMKKGYLSNGKLRTDIKAGEVVAWLKARFSIGAWTRDGDRCVAEGETELEQSAIVAGHTCANPTD